MNRFLAIDDPLFIKWGRPTIISKADINAEYRYKCERCEATWVGPNGDICEWCHKRWQIDQESKRQALLFPEWLSWDERYFHLTPLDQSVWEQTRGYADGFDIAWQNRLKKARDNGEVTQMEFDSATNRYAKWIKRNQSPI